MQLATASGCLIWVSPVSVSEAVVSEIGVVEVLVQSLLMRVDIIIFWVVLTVLKSCSMFISHVVATHDGGGGFDLLGHGTVSVDVAQCGDAG